MKVILYMASTINGMIAKTNDDTSFVSKNEWKIFSGMIRKTGNMIIGRRTYDLMLESDEFNRSKLNKIKIIVLSRRNTKVHDKKYVSVAKTPKEALKVLLKYKFKTAIVCGRSIKPKFLESEFG